MTKTYKTFRAAKAQATRQWNKYRDDLTIKGNEIDGFHLEPRFKEGNVRFIGSASKRLEK